MTEVLTPTVPALSAWTNFPFSQQTIMPVQRPTARSSRAARPKQISSSSSSSPPRTAPADTPELGSPTRPLAFVEGLRGLQDTNARTLIRIHVMKDVVRQKSKPAKDSESRTRRTPAPVGGQKQKFRLQADGLEVFQRSKERHKVARRRGTTSGAVVSQNENWGRREERRQGRMATSASASVRTKSQSGSDDAILSVADDEIANWLEDVDNPALPEESFQPQMISPSGFESYMPGFDDFAYGQQSQDQPTTVAWTSPYDMEQVSTSRLDPFHTLPVPIDRSVERLIDQFHSTFIPCWCPATNTEWFQHAMTDPALFHATLWHFASHKIRLTLRPSKEDTVDLLTHQIKAIQLVNARLGDPLHRLSDSTIATVACIASVETCFSSLQASTVHVNGLREMIAIRGGISSLGFDGLIRRLVFWVDQNFASRQDASVFYPQFLNRNHRPLEPYEPTISLPPRQASPPSSTTPSSKTPSMLIPHLRHASPSAELQTLLEQIHTLSTDLRGKPRESMSQRTRMVFSDKMSLIERSLISQLAAPGADADDDVYASFLLTDAVTLTALLYVQLALRGVVQFSHVIEHLGVRLRNALARLEVGGFDPAALEVPPQQWALMLVSGAVALNGHDGRTWFVRQLGRMRAESRAEEWVGICVWLRGMFELGTFAEHKVDRVFFELDSVDLI